MGLQFLRCRQRRQAHPLLSNGGSHDRVRRRGWPRHLHAFGLDQVGLAVRVSLAYRASCILLVAAYDVPARVEDVLELPCTPRDRFFHWRHG